MLRSRTEGRRPVAFSSMSRLRTSGIPPESFAICLRRVRMRLECKQLWLSGEVGCTDAAICRWERGDRVPSRQLMARLVDALQREGATPAEVASLRETWRRAVFRRTVKPPFEPPQGGKLSVSAA